mmetsp:Transcript_3988/g.7303  ORF Transcript_3988/g.7303 Transcript_3988/m.7303 type:complete len:84 (+) Transcript_3988:105-356(+)
MRVKVLFFAACRDITNVEKLEMELKKGSTVAGFVEAVVKKYPKIEKLLGNMVLSVNLEYTNPKSTDILKDGSEIAFIPPISGG